MTYKFLYYGCIGQNLYRVVSGLPEEDTAFVRTPQADEDTRMAEKAGLNLRNEPVVFIVVQTGIMC